MASPTTTTKPYSTLPPNASPSTIQPFTISISSQKLQDFQTLLRFSPLSPPSYENQEARKDQNLDLGVTRAWLAHAKDYWLNTYSWREQEAYLNSFPQFTASITDDDGRVVNVHFAALFSKKKDAVPIVRMHGWPCTFAEYFPVLEVLKKKYDEGDLPYHIILPSLPGWTFSSPPPLDRDWKYADSARIIHKLMLALGFGDNGYISHGGDIGAAIARHLAVTYPECKAVHLSFCHMPPPDDAEAIEATLTVKELKGVQRADEFTRTGDAYGRMHGTRTATIGHVLSSSPLAMLAWIGEKYLEWADPAHPIPLPTILTEVSLFWFTECAGTSLYTYREDYRWGVNQKGYLHNAEWLRIEKPFGYSYFPEELAAIPKAWAEKTGKFVWFRRHEEGGHYPALEMPEVIVGDVEDFVASVWK
ncbi:alpha/beta-hydrolase [Periconia macrospinosa]|uniref:Alpha/beta-hydrolase n=1 Tax=Periconia macrospinosa TaxID=97972 RepID=A0A2V1DB23_9PLEO|nr:alpha/beta-hydrolase [Periconia macrospinosa]